MDNIKEMPIIVTVPEESTDIIIKSFCPNEDGSMDAYQSYMNTETIQKARRDFVECIGDDDYDARYTITEKGLDLLRKLLP